MDREVPDLILLDLKMPGLSGLETLKAIRSKFPQAFVIMLTSYGTVEDAVEAMKLGAYDFVIKTVDLDGLDQVVGRALELLTLRRRVIYEAERQGDEFSMAHLIAESAAMRALVGQVRDVAQNPKTTVLLLGETGTGKEFIARVLHHNGQRAAAPFIGVNCTAIPRELFESELFGYERGAFTGAHHRKLGVLDRAEGGTLFLDEIGDLDLAMQAKLLRVLQERKFQRVGGTEEIAADFRLIAATNRDLKKEIVKGAFREDLYFRLNVVSFELPPLRSRVEDIFPLGIKALMRYGRNSERISLRSMPRPERFSNAIRTRETSESCKISWSGPPSSARDERSRPVAFRGNCRSPSRRPWWPPPREISGPSVSI